MALMEAKAYGIPTVSYSMPYLEAVREEYGCIVVGKKDIQGMAQAVSDLLDDFPRLNELGRKARESLRFFGNDRVYRRWKLLFQTLETGVEPDTLTAPPFTHEESIQCMKIQNAEIICGVDYMLANPLFVKKMRKSVEHQLKQESPVFVMAFKLNLALSAIQSCDGKKGHLLRRGGHFIFKMLTGISLVLKRVYRFFVPWKASDPGDS